MYSTLSVSQRKALFCFIATVLLLGSWLYPESRSLWDRLDTGFFFWANGSLAKGDPWVTFWALTNNRLYDGIMGGVILLLYMRFIAEKRFQYWRERVAFGIFMAGYTVLAIQVAHMVCDAFAYDRASPTLALQPAYLLSGLVPWVHAKDQSAMSFPSDHASVLFLVAALMGMVAGKKYAITGSILAMTGVVPRLVSGAHWLTDVMVGGGAITFAAFFFLYAFSLHIMVVPYITQMVHALYKRLR